MRTEDSHMAKMGLPPAPSEVTDPVDVALPEPIAAIPVRDESPALGTWRSMKITSNNPVRMLLPQDPRRRYAVISTDDSHTVICSTQDMANTANGVASTADFLGFRLPQNTLLTIHNKAECWVTYTTDATLPVHVSVLVEKDDE